MMQRLFFVIGVLLTVPPAFGQEVAFDVPPVVLTGIPFDVSVTSNDVLFDASHAASYTVRMDGAVFPMHFKKDKDGARRLVAEGLRAAQGGPVTVELAQGGVTMARAMSRSIPGWLSLLPPLLAILAALLFKRVVPALFLGIWAGAWIAVGSTGVGSGLLDA
ncbi:MAG: Na+/H+ antiporter NhaC family protein, partial [Rhodothermales bacterium]